jgi:hypothetical protein
MKKRKRILEGTIYEPVGEALVSLSEIIEDAIRNKITGFYENPVYINARNETLRLLEGLSENKDADSERIAAYKRTYRGLVDNAVMHYERMAKNASRNVEDSIKKTSPLKHSVGKRRYNPNDGYVSKTVTSSVNRMGGLNDT